MTKEEINFLGDIVDTTFGKMSSPNGDFSLKCIFVDDKIILKYTTLVHFASDHSLQLQLQRCKDEGVSRIKEYLKKIKEEFKKRAERSLKAKMNDFTDDVELVSMSTLTPRKVAYYRMNLPVTIS